MKENNEVMQGDNTVGAVLNAKTKEKFIMGTPGPELINFNKGDKMKQVESREVKDIVEAIKKVAENRTYKLGDEVKAYGKNCKIVEVLAEGRYHLKNLQEPYDSFVALVEEFE